MVDTGLEVHLADMAGGAGGNLQHAHPGRRGDGVLHPGAGRIVPVRQGGECDQDDDRMGVALERFGP